jgi:hypothetical protein
MNKKVLFLRISFWVGAIIDGAAGIIMVMRQYVQTSLTSPDFQDYKYMAAALMFGWTFLLVWADRKPMERKGVLLLTVCPVLLGLMASRLFGVFSGIAPFGEMPFSFVVQAVLVLFFGFSYLYAGK